MSLSAYTQTEDDEAPLEATWHADAKPDADAHPHRDARSLRRLYDQQDEQLVVAGLCPRRSAGTNSQEVVGTGPQEDSTRANPDQPRRWALHGDVDGGGTRVANVDRP